MERIVIEVEDDVAKRWNLSSEKLRDKVSKGINIIMAKELMADSKEEFKLFLSELAGKMKERGLTEEILYDILNDEE